MTAQPALHLLHCLASKVTQLLSEDKHPRICYTYLYLIDLEFSFDVCILSLKSSQSRLNVLVSADEREVGGRVHIL